jgi:DNA-binding NarL/FixJ family response regulator
MLCDDHVVVREGLRGLLDAVDDIEVVACACDGAEGVEAAVLHRPDVALMDLSMPGIDGVEATRLIAARVPETSVVVVTSYADERRVLDAIDAGAVGYVVKDAPADQLITSVRAAACGDAFLDPRAARPVMTRQTPRSPLLEMTEREREVLRLVGAGLPNKLIALRLGISQSTVKNHVTRILREIGADNRSQAALWARERGLR